MAMVGLVGAWMEVVDDMHSGQSQGDHDMTSQLQLIQNFAARVIVQNQLI